MSWRVMSHFSAIISAERNWLTSWSPYRLSQPGDSANGVENPYCWPTSIAAEIGMALMFCTPPATTRSWVPDMIPWAAKCTACWEEPHWRSMVAPGTCPGNPATSYWRPLTMTHHDAHLARSVELAREALDAGDDPFGSVLVDADDNVVAEARNKESSLADPTAHPELELAQWASRNLSAHDRAGATVYTSSEHCPMCAAAHGWVGLGPVVFAASSQQLSAW